MDFKSARGTLRPILGIASQSGTVIALQIVEQQPAEILRIVGNLLVGDCDTIRAVGKCLFEILDRDFPRRIKGDEGYEGYMVRAVAEAVLGLAKEGDKNE